MRTEGNRGIRPGIRTMIIGTKAYRIVNNRGKNRYNNKRKGGNQVSRNTRQQTSRNNSRPNPTCAKCGKNHPGECRQGTTVCYKCGKEGHYAKGCMVKTVTDQKQNKS